MADSGAAREGASSTVMIGESDAWKEIVRSAKMVSATDATVLITGESGTGKELVATSIHEQSTRSRGPFVAVNCAAIPSELFESEFFGHARGSFTGAVSERAGRFELAHGGTILLDEIGEIPLELQGKLLRVLQEGRFERVGENRTRTVDVRVIAATNRDLRAAAEAGEFRSDLYYRLSVFPIELPPLRERLDDVPELANHFLRKYAAKHACPTEKFSDEQLEALKRYHYPGNVRELENIVERITIVAGCGLLKMDVSAIIRSMLIPEKEREISDLISARPETGRLLTYPELRKLEKENLIAALKTTGFKIYGEDGAARLLDIKPTTLTSKIRSMGIVKEPSAT